jgi:hypothetical protein
LRVQLTSATLTACRCANEEFARVHSWLVASKYSVYHAGDVHAMHAKRAGLRPLGNLIHINQGVASSEEVTG